MRKTIHSEEQQVLVAVLREVRERRGVRQIDLAERLGRPQSFVSKYERGERRLDLVELHHIAVALDIKLIDIVRKFEQRL